MLVSLGLYGIYCCYQMMEVCQTKTFSTNTCYLDNIKEDAAIMVAGMDALYSVHRKIESLLTYFGSDHYHHRNTNLNK